jgi:hypothetical protein
MVHMTLVTVDTTVIEECLLGYTIFPLFIDPVTKMPVLNSENLSK